MSSQLLPESFYSTEDRKPNQNMLDNFSVRFSAEIYDYLLESGYTHLLMLQTANIIYSPAETPVRYLVPLKNPQEAFLNTNDQTIVELATLDVAPMLIIKMVLFNVVLLPNQVMNTDALMSSSETILGEEGFA